jgi:hypothetical protein
MKVLEKLPLCEKITHKKSYLKNYLDSNQDFGVPNRKGGNGKSDHANSMIDVINYMYMCVTRLAMTVQLPILW